MSVDYNQLINQLAPTVLGAVSGQTGMQTNGVSQIVRVGGKRYRVKQTSAGSFLIPIGRQKRIVFTEKSLRAFATLVRLGSSMAGGRRRSGGYSFRPMFRKR